MTHFKRDDSFFGGRKLAMLILLSCKERKQKLMGETMRRGKIFSELEV